MTPRVALCPPHVLNTRVHTMTNRKEYAGVCHPSLLVLGPRIPDSVPKFSVSDPCSLLPIQENPYVMRRPNFQALSGNERFEGFCVDMLRELAELLRFRYRLRLVEDGLYGAPEPNGSWTGMVGELINRVRLAGGWGSRTREGGARSPQSKRNRQKLPLAPVCLARPGREGVALSPPVFLLDARSFW